MRQNRKKKKTIDERKKNLRRLPPPIVTAQTRYHLYQICAANCWGERDVGKAIDMVTREYCERRHRNEW